MTKFVILNNYEQELIITMRLIDYIRNLNARGLSHFTSDQAQSALAISRDALRSSIKRMKEKNLIASTAKNFFIIIPAEYTVLGCLPAEQFIPHLMKFWHLDYYICLLSAAEFYGAAHQRPQTFQVMTNCYKPELQCGNVSIRFIQKKKMDNIPTQTFNTPRSIIKVSTPEVTAMDLINYPWQSGGLSNIATVLTELAEKIEVGKLMELTNYCIDTPWVQRLGYLFSTLGQQELASGLKNILKEREPKLIPLSPDRSIKGCPRIKEWNVAINFNIEADI